MSGYEEHGFARRLVAADLDCTIAETQVPSPNNMTVDHAARLAMQAIAPEREKAFGGLRNRATSEVIADTFPDATPEEQAVLAELFDEQKYGYTRSEIGAPFRDGSGRRWPELVPGFYSAYRRLESQPHIDLGIMSSASEERGIKPILELYDIEPAFIVGIEAAARHTRMRQLEKIPFKPSIWLIRFVLEEWSRQADLGPFLSNDYVSKYVIAVGDDLEKDGLPAQLSGIDFVHIHGTPHEKEQAWDLCCRKVGA